jgi:hypothetical protein
MMRGILGAILLCACGVALPGDTDARWADGSLRRAFLGGHFVTFAKEFPVELDQVLAGETPDHSVVVWAGGAETYE